jgi:transglutaminase-like putative cysteine protease
VQRLTVKHTTEYRYRRAVEFGEHRLMLRPRDSHDLRLLESTLKIEPAAELRWLYDVFGNSVAIAAFQASSDRLGIESQIVIDRYPLDRPAFPIEPYARRIPFSYPAREIPDLGRTIERHHADPDRLVTEWARRFLDDSGVNGETEAFLLALTSAVRRELVYVARHDPGVQTPAETLALKSGSCRDFALLMMEAVRSVGLAARFVSGYLYDPSLDGEAADAVGAGTTHAWVQIYLPGAGWIEFDPTNGKAGGQNLVPIAVAREPAQAVPVSGTFAGGSDDFLALDVAVTVTAQSSLRMAG